MLVGFDQTGHWKYIKLKINKGYVKVPTDMGTIKNVDQKCYALMYYYRHTVLFFELKVNNAESL